MTYGVSNSIATAQERLNYLRRTSSVNPRNVSATMASLFESYCVNCHSAANRAGGLDLNLLRSGNVTENTSTWELVLRRLRARRDPPSNLPRPDDKGYRFAISNLDGTGVERADPHGIAVRTPPLLVTIRASQVEVCWNSTSNLTYQVQYRSALTTNLWTSLLNCVRSTGSKSCINDPILLGQPQRFYRVIQTNCVPSL